MSIIIQYLPSRVPRYELVEVVLNPLVPSAPSIGDTASLMPSLTTVGQSEDEEPICKCCHNYLCSPPPRERKPTPSSPLASLAGLPDDCLEAIASSCGSDLGRFASISKGVRSHVGARPELWRRAYQQKFTDDVDEWGTDAISASSTLWRACLLRTASGKQM